MDVGAGHQMEGDTFLIDGVLEFLNGTADLGPRIVIHPRHDMGGASHDPHTVGNEGSRHAQRYGQVRRAIVNSRQDMAMQVDHGSRNNELKRWRRTDRHHSDQKKALTSYWTNRTCCAQGTELPHLWEFHLFFPCTAKKPRATRRKYLWRTC